MRKLVYLLSKLGSNQLHNLHIQSSYQKRASQNHYKSVTKLINLYLIQLIQTGNASTSDTFGNNYRIFQYKVLNIRLFLSKSFYKFEKADHLYVLFTTKTSIYLVDVLMSKTFRNKTQFFFLNILLSLQCRHKIRFMERDSEHDAVLNHMLLAYDFHTWGQKRLNIKGALSNLRYFLATKSPLKLIRNTFYFNLKFRNL